MFKAEEVSIDMTIEGQISTNLRVTSQTWLKVTRQIEF
jgi:hypothetical protein